MSSKKISYPVLPLWSKSSSERQQTHENTPQPARVTTRPRTVEAEAAEIRISEWRARCRWAAVRK